MFLAFAAALLNCKRGEVVVSVPYRKSHHAALEEVTPSFSLMAIQVPMALVILPQSRHVLRCSRRNEGDPGRHRHLGEDLLPLLL